MSTVAGRLMLESLRELLANEKIHTMVREADTVEIRPTTHFTSPGETPVAFVMDPNDPFFLGRGRRRRRQVWVVCHPDDEAQVRQLVDRIREER